MKDNFFVQYVVTGLLFAAIDAVWLMLISKKFYRDRLGHLLKPKPQMVPAVIFYLLYVFGIVFFALDPAIQVQSSVEAIGRGAVLGLLMYATYDLTNQSTVKGWPLKVTLVDLAWGTFATALATYLSFVILR